MTIKTNGGIFGRNPTFNEIGGTLTTAAQPNITSLGTQTSNLSFASGQGIDFSASEGGGSSSSIMDDYEEGTFTATVAPETSGTTALVKDTLAYTKIGNVVCIQGRLVFDTPSSAIGSYVTIEGLPFTSTDLGEDAGRFTGSVTVDDGGTFLTAPTTGLEGRTSIRVRIDASDLGFSDDFYCGFFYFTSS